MVDDVEENFDRGRMAVSNPKNYNSTHNVGEKEKSGMQIDQRGTQRKRSTCKYFSIL